MVKVLAFDTLASGLTTVTGTVPATAMSAAAIAAVNRVELTNVLVRAAPFQRTLEPLTKLVPLTVSVNAGPPAATLFGDSELTVGAGGATLVIVLLFSRQAAAPIHRRPSPPSRSTPTSRAPR